MNPLKLRALMHFAALGFVIVLFFALPFGPVVNGLIAGAIWLIDGSLTEYIFRRRATLQQQAEDLRDRVDNPPS